MVVRIVPSDGPAPEEKLADAELVFEEGLLAGMKLVGFSIWRGRRSVLPAVTFPSRSFQVNGERRAYALLRPSSGGNAQELLRAVILQAYAEYERQLPRPIETDAEQVVATGMTISGVLEGGAEGDHHESDPPASHHTTNDHTASDHTESRSSEKPVGEPIEERAVDVAAEAATASAGDRPAVS